MLLSCPLDRTADDDADDDDEDDVPPPMLDEDGVPFQPGLQLEFDEDTDEDTTDEPIVQDRTPPAPRTPAWLDKALASVQAAAQDAAALCVGTYCQIAA